MDSLQNLINDSISATENKVVDELHSIDKQSLCNQYFDDISIFTVLLVGIIFVFLIKLALRLTKSKPIINQLDEQEFRGVDSGDFSSVFSGLSNQKEAKVLRDKLIRVAHPDRFPSNQLKREIASEITSLITKNSHDLNKLKELEVRVNIELK